MQEQVVVLGAARTPIGRFLGGLSPVAAPDLGATAIRGAIRRAGIEPAAVEAVIMGNVISAGVGQAPARQAAIRAGVPERASVMTVNKVCASGLEAVHLAAQSVLLGEADVVVAGGMENMSRAPHLLMGSRQGFRLGTAQLLDAAVHDGLWCAFENQHMGHAAEAIAEKYGITRQEMDEYSLRSHQKAVQAIQEGRFRAEIEPVEVPQRKGTLLVEVDEPPRPDTSLEALSKLPPAFLANGRVTAGNSPGLTDGAAALVIASEKFAARKGLEPLARIVGYASVGNQPLWLFDAPADAVRKLLDRTGTTLEEWDLLEINEAFSSQILANGRVLGWDWSRVNVNGGAIALGHPLGATGARLVVTLVHALKDRGLRKGIAALCHGGGGAVAMAFELVRR